MSEIQLGVVESKFADIIWDLAPVSTSELVRIASDRFEWKRTTTHTVIRRLCDKGLFVNESGTVNAVITRDEFYSARTVGFVEDAFKGSLPDLVSAFARGRKISRKEAEAIRKILDDGLET